LWFWEAAVLVLRCDSCGKRRAVLIPESQKLKEKRFVEAKYFGGLDIGGLNYMFAT
jgi:hypothetical protein